MSYRRRRGGKPASNQRAGVAYLPALLFCEDDHEWSAESPIAGCLRRYSPRAAALLMYLMFRHDYLSGRVSGCVADWSRPVEHCRDPKTLRLALGELRGDLDTPGGERITVLEEVEGALYFSEEFWRVRMEVRAHRKTQAPGPYGAVRISATVYRGGPWAVLTDTARVLYGFMRLLAAAEYKRDREGNYINDERRPAALLSRRSGFCESTVLAGVTALERVLLVTVKRVKFRTNVYRAAFDVTVKLFGCVVNFAHTVESQLRGRNPRPLRAQCVEHWHRVAGKRRPVRLAPALAPLT